MIRLTDLQLILLTAAAQRADGSILPPPENVATRAARIRKCIQPLITHALVMEGPSDPVSAWRQDGDSSIGVFITTNGREAIGAPGPVQRDAARGVEAAVTKAPSKAGAVLAMMEREQGATLEELVAATGWLPHTTRAALTGLRKKGHAIDRGKRGDITCYSIARAA